MANHELKRYELVEAIHRSKVVGSDKVARLWDKYKGFIVASMQEHMNKLNILRPVYGMEFPDDFNERVEKCNLPTEYKNIILGRIK